MTWLTALTAWPAPIGPTWVMVLPIAARTGRARSTSADSPPTKIVSVAFLAPSLPPETGASTMDRPCSLRRAAKSQLPEGAIVEQSTISVPARAPPATPSWPNRTASTSGVSDTQMTTISAVAAAAAGFGAVSTPRSSSAGARPGVRFHAITWKPPRARLAAIAAPIVPSPRKATRCCSVMAPIVVDGAGEAQAQPRLGPRIGFFGRATARPLSERLGRQLERRARIGYVAPGRRDPPGVAVEQEPESRGIGLRRPEEAGVGCRFKRHGVCHACLRTGSAN